MLVTLSDLHLNDGSTAPVLDAGAMDLFLERLREMAYRASWRAGGDYRPIERIDLVLLGDTLDLARSARWQATSVRPWDTNRGPLMEAWSAITDDILRTNADLLGKLRAIATEGTVTIPQPNYSGRPDYSDEMSIPVRIHYMVGECDWPLHLRSPQMDMLRHKVAHQLGLASLHNQPFPHEPAETEELLDALRRHRAIARHGDIFDPLSYGEDRDLASWNDAIAIELVGRFLADVERELAGALSPAAIAALQQIDLIRPILLAPVWLEGMLERTVNNLAVRKAVKRIWDNAADAMLSLDLGQHKDTSSALNLVDGLAAALKFTRRDSTAWAARTLGFLHKLRGAASDSYACHALNEPEFRNRRARHIIYGHTSVAETIPLEASFADGYVLSQTYFNAGSWRRSYRPAINAAGGHEFIPSETLSYLALYQGDERSGRPFETWSGSLAVSLLESMSGPIEMAPAAQPPLKSPHFGRSHSPAPYATR
jgi:hypothetical protein